MSLFVPPSGRRTTELTGGRTADQALGVVRRSVPGPPAGAAARPSARPSMHPSSGPAAVATALSRGAVLAVLAVELLVPGGWGQAAWVPLVAGLLLGLPHGAVDHLVPDFALGPSRRRTAFVTVAYAALALVVLAAFRAWPGPALALFVLLSAAHFGTGETAFADLRAGRPPGVDVLGAAAFGAAAVVVPLLASADAVAPVIALVVPGTDGRLASTASRVAVAALLVVIAAAVAVRVRRRQWDQAGELVLLTVAGLVVPVAAFFGAYFGTWHSGRHTARLLVENPVNGPDLAAGRLGRPLLRFARTAALPTLAALSTVLVLWATAGGWKAFVAADLAVLAALTVPHVLVVTWLDIRCRARPLGDHALQCGPTEVHDQRGVRERSSATLLPPSTTRH